MRPALALDDVEGADIFDLTAQSTPLSHSIISLNNVRGTMIHGCRVATPPLAFLQVDGATSNRILLRANDLGSTKQPVHTGPDVLFARSDKVIDRLCYTAGVTDAGLPRLTKPQIQ